MKSYSVNYKFSQRFNLSAETAYLWCTEYQPDDYAKMGINGKRRVILINENTLVLADTMFEKGEKVTKRRLVKLYPKRLFWTNTRLSADGRYSQFLYKIVPEGDSHSRLDFIGSQIYYGSAKPSQAEMDRASQELAECDSSIWRYLATAMEKDLGRSKSVTLFMRPKMIKVR